MIGINELRKKTKEDLKSELEKIEKEYRKVVSDILQKKEKNVRKSGSFKKDIARIKTLLNEAREEGLVNKEGKVKIEKKNDVKDKEVNIEKEDKSKEDKIEVKKLKKEKK